MDLDVTSPKQLNRRVFLKQLAVDLCTSERRILFRTQYVSIYHTSLLCLLVDYFSELLPHIIQPLLNYLQLQVPCRGIQNFINSLLLHTVYQYHGFSPFSAFQIVWLALTVLHIMVHSSPSDYAYVNCYQILRRRLRDIRSGELRALRIFDGFRKLFK